MESPNRCYAHQEMLESGPDSDIVLKTVINGLGMRLASAQPKEAKKARAAQKTTMKPFFGLGNVLRSVE